MSAPFTRQYYPTSLTFKSTRSISWPELGNGMRAGRVSLKSFQKCLKQGPPSLYRVRVDKVTVVDFLGRNIPVPILFCSTWTVSSYYLRMHMSHPSSPVRPLTISSTDTVKITPEMGIWSEATIKFYVPKIA